MSQKQQCPICKKEFNRLVPAHAKMHGTTLEQMKKDYDIKVISWTNGLKTVESRFTKPLIWGAQR